MDKVEKEKVRKVFLEDLPRTYKGVNWKESIGKDVNFVFEELMGELTIIDYNSETRKISVKYLDNEMCDINTSSFIAGHISEILGKKHHNYLFPIGTLINTNNRNLIITNQKRKENNFNHLEKCYTYRCETCGYNGEMLEHSLVVGEGCPCCSNKKAVLGINTIWDTDRWMVDLGVSEEDAKKYTYGSKHKVYPICHDCGHIREKPIEINVIHRNKSIHCMCGDGQSYPNKFSYSFLDQLNNFYSFDHLEHEYSPDWIKPLRYDNYFEYNNIKYIFEMDGGWHTQDNTLSGQTVEKSKDIDVYKDRLATEHGYKIIRIACLKSDLDCMKLNISNSKLLELFDLSKINWLKCEEFALSNLVKKACDLKLSNEDLSTTQIGNIMKLTKRTIQTYLKKGTKLGWCDYNPIKEREKNFKKAMYTISKPICVYKENILIGQFVSANELYRQSFKLFGVWLVNDTVSQVCNGKRKSYKGFTFQFMSKKEFRNNLIEKGSENVV